MVCNVAVYFRGIRVSVWVMAGLINYKLLNQTSFSVSLKKTLFIVRKNDHTNIKNMKVCVNVC